MTSFYLLATSKVWYREKYYYIMSDINHKKQTKSTGYSTVNKKITRSMDGLHYLKEKLRMAVFTHNKLTDK